MAHPYGCNCPSSHPAAQSNHCRVGQLLQIGRFSQGPHESGPLSDPACLELRQTSAPQEECGLALQQVLWAEEPTTEGSVGIWGYRERNLPRQVFMDKDRAARPGQRRCLTGRREPCLVLAAAHVKSGEVVRQDPG